MIDSDPSGSLLRERIRIVLSRTSHPGNIGGAARAMKTMGLSRLVLVAPKEFPHEHATAMAVGADDILANAQVVDAMADALRGTVTAIALTARRRELATPALWVRDAAADAVRQGELGDVAIVFGNETSGLSNEELGLCRHWAMIPAAPAFSSLNLAAAVQVMCYELRLAALAPGQPPEISGAGMPASHEEIEGLIAHIERAAIGSGFLDPAKPRRLIPRVRRLLARAVPEKEEINILRGMVAALEHPLPGAPARTPAHGDAPPPTEKK